MIPFNDYKCIDQVKGSIKQSADRFRYTGINLGRRFEPGVKTWIAAPSREKALFYIDTVLSKGIGYIVTMIIEFNGKIWYWHGPSPFYFVTVPAEQSVDLKMISAFVTYGWGMIPVKVRIGKTEFKTSMFPKDGRYIVPIKASVRKDEELEIDDQVTVRLEVG